MKIGIVGLGLAGLRTAMLLERAGAEIVLFEARERAGGRAWTVEEDGRPLYDAGGEWIDADHTRILALLDEAALVPEAPPDGTGIVIHQGERIAEEELWDDAVETGLAVDSHARELCRELRMPAWDNQWAARLDDSDLASFLGGVAASDRAHFWVTAKYRDDEGEDLERIGLLGWLAGFMHYVPRQGGELAAYRVPGGVGALLEWMQSQIAGRAAFGHFLQAVRQDRSGVCLIFGDREVRVDRAVLTLPPPCLGRVRFEPALPAEKLAAIEACRLGRTIKICWRFERFWWREQGLSGSIVCDGPLQSVWDSSIGETPVLCAYVCGQNAADLAGRRDPVRAGLDLLAAYYPDAGKCFVNGRLHDWPGDPLSGGGFSHMQPGYVLSHLRFIAPPVGRIHFAGEHTASWTGFMEGALESAERVSAEMLAAG